ncbi:hypothetical protein HPB51_029580 [Rhipicephalus microplus]|uniref:HTH psq-type domain-containing protein n=1 Tax=Rhipicephalus microplus TaxID=6941 RepID=A0A9J6CTS7_RHIMP|nr:hypothetical protein HPB51_029580 [Rhipicephalus microplus]
MQLMPRASANEHLPFEMNSRPPLSLLLFETDTKTAPRDMASAKEHRQLAEAPGLPTTSMDTSTSELDRGSPELGRGRLSPVVERSESFKAIFPDEFEKKLQREERIRRSAALQTGAVMTMATREPYRSLDLAMKVKILKEVEVGGTPKQDIAWKHGIKPNTLSNILKSKSSLLDTFENENDQFKLSCKRMRTGAHP